ncbi:PBP1A family penicillin-binding protein [Lentibacillus sp. L22]|uniref:PBP1A family penicillin-binding protein n=1 Tax=Lentibacillus sp. L22 TaxID=3163028 RepID=UPI0034673D31
MSDEYTSRQERRRQQKQKKTRSHGRKRSLWKKILLGLCAAFLLAVIACGITIAVMIHDAPTLKASDLQTPQSTRIYDQDGKLVSTVFHEENRVKIHIDDVPETVKDAVISIEDKRFRDHHGIDFHRLFGAVFANVKNGWGAEGGSTITQQVIKRSVLTPEKTLKRKVQEAWLSLKLERKYSKDEILEMYLNNVYFGHRAYGIKTASKTYFGENNLSKLNISQAALLAGLPNAPSADDPFKHPERAQKRRDQVLSAMESNHVISKQQADKAKAKPISEIIRKEEKKQENNDDPYNAFIDTVYEQMVNQKKVVSEKDFYQGGLKIYTTLDSKAQKAVYDLIHSKDIPYPDKHFETGITLVDTKTGAIKAVGGGRHFKAVGYTNYGTNVQNQPGSTIKPILDYAPAIEHLNWPTSHTLSDEPYQYSDGTPINEWDNKYWGDISMRRALEWSRNIPALKAFQAVGQDKAQKFAKGLGIKIDPIFESASIGGFDGVSPLQMAGAYAAFGNGGKYHEPSTVKKIVFPDGKKWKPKSKPKNAMHDYTAYMITDMLKTVVASGTGTQANIPGIPVAGKTGTTNIPNDIKDQYGLGDGVLDSWFVGYTPQYSLAVWTGYPSLKNKDGDVQYIRYDGSQNIAMQLFQTLMSEISDPNMDDFKKPDSVVSSGSELYVRGAQYQPSEEQADQGTNEENQNQEEQQETTEQPNQEENTENQEQEEEQEEEQDKEEEQANQEEDKDSQEQEDEQDKEQPDQEEDKDNQEQEDKQDKEEADKGEDKEDKQQEDEQDKEKANQEENKANQEEDKDNQKQEDQQKNKEDDHSSEDNNDNEHNNKDKKKDNDSESDNENNNSEENDSS